MVVPAEGGDQQDAGRDRGDDDEYGEPAPPDAVRRTLGARCPPMGPGRRHPRDRITMSVLRPGTPCTIEHVNAPAGPPPRIEIPRWIQLIGLPVAIFFAWVFGQAVGHTVFL